MRSAIWLGILLAGVLTWSLSKTRRRQPRTVPATTLLAATGIPAREPAPRLTGGRPGSRRDELGLLIVDIAPWLHVTEALPVASAQGSSPQSRGGDLTGRS